jgi:DNA-binding NarL/FixJ family response regulator
VKAVEDPDLPATPPIPRKLALGAALALAAIAALAALDLLQDATAGVPIRHALLEGSIVALAAAGAFALGREAVRQRARAHAAELAASTLIHDVARARADAERWRQEAAELLRGLSEAIDRQLTAWGLTESEQAIARLLLKGLSHKEIAELRGASDATVRQQAATIYRKSNLAGRAELAAFFLEDLLAPAPAPRSGSTAAS